MAKKKVKKTVQKKTAAKANKTVKSKVRKIKNEEDSVIYAFIATFFSIIGFIVALVAKKNDAYVRYYAKHSLIIFIVSFVGGVIVGLLDFIPVLGWLINFAFAVVVLIAWILSWIYALSGEKKEIPIISDWSNKFKL